MSDGDNATPGSPGAWVAGLPTAPTNGLPDLRGQRQAPRRGSANGNSDEPEADDDARRRPDSHTDGVTVADLIAKVTASRRPTSRAGTQRQNPSPRRRRHAATPPPRSHRASRRAPPGHRQPRQLRPSAATEDDRPGHRGHPRASSYADRSCPIWPSCAGAAGVPPARVGSRAGREPRPPTPRAAARRWWPAASPPPSSRCSRSR